MREKIGVSVFYDHILQAAEQTGKPLKELLNGARGAGIEAVEINMTYLYSHEETYDLLREAGLHISCIYEFYEMDHKDEKEKAKMHIDTAFKARAEKILVVPGFFSNEEAEALRKCVPEYHCTAALLSKNEKAMRIAEGLDDIVSLGTDAGIAVTVEDFDDTKSPLCCENGVCWFLEQIPLLKMTFDTGNFIIHGEDVLEAWELLKERVVHVHCKDRGEQSVAVGDGYLPMSKVLDNIVQTGYKGYLAIEHFDAANQEACMKKSAAFLRSRIASV